eukprot:3940580-Rhodomonas_salina.2
MLLCSTDREALRYQAGEVGLDCVRENYFRTKDCEKDHTLVRRQALSAMIDFFLPATEVSAGLRVARVLADSRSIIRAVCIGPGTPRLVRVLAVKSINVRHISTGHRIAAA